MEPDFSGYATKAGLTCSDGRVIMPDAFKGNHGQTVPLVWSHDRSKPDNVLGHVKLDNRDDGVYAFAYFNETPQGVVSKQLVEHKDIVSLSIFATNVIEKGKNVVHGVIREVSLVMSGANPGAFIENVALAHGDDYDGPYDEAIIYTGLAIEHEGEPAADTSTTDTTDTTSTDDGPTVQDVYDSMTQPQKDVLEYMVATALEEAAGAAKDDNAAAVDDAAGSTEVQQDDSSVDGTLTHEEGTEMTKNVFEQNGAGAQSNRQTLTHDQLRTIVEDAQRMGSFKESFLQHAVEYGIENIDFLFPDARTIENSPEFISRRMEWVTTVLNGARHSPFSRIKSVSADITHDEARAKGYIKATLKKEEFFALSKRVTTPTTIYKKQKLDRDDIIDITDLDVVAWLKAEMRVMLDEEVARAALLGDGREVDDEDKINEQNIRPIAKDDPFYADQIVIPANVVGDALVEAILRARPSYHGQGNPALYTTDTVLTDLLLIKDKMGRRLFETQAALEATLRVSKIIPVPVMEGETTDQGELLAILVNMSDYTFGADKGGAIAMFDDFDIDYNQYKYLIETRLSGCLTHYKSAQVFSRGVTGATVVVPNVPTFDPATGVLTINLGTGVEYDHDGTKVATGGAQPPVASGATTYVSASPLDGYAFPAGTDADWTFQADLY